MRVLIYNYHTGFESVFLINSFDYFPEEHSILLYPVDGIGDYHFKLLNVSREDFHSYCVSILRQGFADLRAWPAHPVMEEVE